MAETRLSPTELDRLEDALEDLEFAESIEDPSAMVSSRLADYQLILSASREAFPLEDVPSGALRGVLLEAGTSVEDTVAKVAAKQSERPGLWARLRKGFLMPGLAVAGSAALVLLIVRPSMDDSAAAPAGSSAPAPADRAAPAAADAPEETLAQEDSAPPPPPAAAAPAEAEHAKDLGKLGDVSARSRTSGTRGPGQGAAPMPTTKAEAAASPDPAPERDPANSPVLEDESSEADKKAPADASASGWEAVERGDTARTGGDCFTARNHYARALDDGNDSVRARAFAGLGLCKEKDGDDAAAAEFFERARELDPEADDYAGTQLSERKAKPAPARPKRKRSSKKRKMDAFEPFK